MQRKITAALLGGEVELSASRSSGAGGQNVNKVNTKITLRFDIGNSKILSDDEKRTINLKLHSKLTADGTLIITSQEHRTQHANKEAVIRKFDEMMKKAFAVRKPRRPTAPTKSSIEKRLKQKKLRSERKAWRKSDRG